MDLKISKLSDLTILSHMPIITNVLQISFKLDLFKKLGKDECSLEDIAMRVECYPDRLERILDVLVMVSLIKHEKGKYINTDISYKYLTGLYNTKLDRNMENALNDKSILKFISKKEIIDEKEEDENLHSFLETMDFSSKYSAYQLWRELRPQGNKVMLDVGCGSGIFSFIMCKYSKNMRAVCIDNEEVLKILSTKIEGNGLSDRITMQVCDISESDFTNGCRYDYILLSNILHFFSEDGIKRILQLCFSALNKGGKLIINDVFLLKDEDETLLYQLKWMTMDVLFIDKQRLQDEILKLGFKNIKSFKIQHTPLSFIIAEKNK